METESEQSDSPLVICIDSPSNDTQNSPIPRLHQLNSPNNVVGASLKPDTTQFEALPVMPAGLFAPGYAVMDPNDAEAINQAVHLHLKRPLFESCVRLFRSKLFEIAQVPEDSETPDLPAYKLRTWKDAISRHIGLGFLDTRKLNDCYKHDMRTARSPRVVWKEIDILFRLWRKKEVLGQVKDTLRQTQFKIINSVPLARRVELLRQVNQRKLEWQNFLDLCKEEYKSLQSSTTAIIKDLEETVCTSDGEDDVILEKTPGTLQQSGQVEDSQTKIRILERRWLEAENRATEIENAAKKLSQDVKDKETRALKLQYVLIKQQQANAELTEKLKKAQSNTEECEAQISQLKQELHSLSERGSHQGGLTDDLQQQNKFQAEALHLKSMQLEAKDKEIELVKVQAETRLKVCEAELALKTALLVAKEKELELERIKSEVKKNVSKRQRSIECDVPSLINNFNIRHLCNGNEDQSQNSSSSHHGNHESANKYPRTERSDTQQRSTRHNQQNSDSLDEDGEVTIATNVFWKNMADTAWTPESHHDTGAETTGTPPTKRIKIEPSD